MARDAVTMAVLLTLLTAPAYAGSRLTRVFVNGLPLCGKTIVQKAVTYVPLRAVAESLGCAVDYDPKDGMFVWSPSLESPHAPEVPVPAPVPNPRPAAPQPPVPGSRRPAPGVP